jgi:RNA recognition motif-containing protein
MDIYVGNLPYAATDNDLQELFANYGTVTSARVIMDRMTGRSKGFGFVEMPERAEADQAIEAINGSDFMGRPLRVNESQPRPRNDGGGGGRRGGFGGQNRW